MIAWLLIISLISVIVEYFIMT